MENMNLIDENQYFVESKKVIQLVLETEQNLGKQLKTEDKLQLVKEHKKNTTSPVEYEELEKLEKELERKIRFNQFTIPAVPEEHQAKVKRNAAAEQLELDKKLNELKGQLKERIEYVENDLMPLIENINKLESMKKIPDQINALLSLEIGEKAPVTAEYRLRVYNSTKDTTKTGQAKKDLMKVLKSLKEIEVPVETKGLLDFLKRGRK